MGKELLQVKLGRMKMAIDNLEGYCPNCNSFCYGPVEPDAREYECPECHGNRFMGAEEAILCGHIILITGGK